MLKDNRWLRVRQRLSQHIAGIGNRGRHQHLYARDLRDPIGQAGRRLRCAGHHADHQGHGQLAASLETQAGGIAHQRGKHREAISTRHFQHGFEPAQRGANTGAHQVRGRQWANTHPFRTETGR